MPITFAPFISPNFSFPRIQDSKINFFCPPVSFEVDSLIEKNIIPLEDEDISILKPGDIFYVSSKPHDSWVVGDEAYISLHFLGADKYIQ